MNFAGQGICRVWSVAWKIAGTTASSDAGKNNWGNKRFCLWPVILRVPSAAAATTATTTTTTVVVMGAAGSVFIAVGRSSDVASHVTSQ